MSCTTVMRGNHAEKLTKMEKLNEKQIKDWRAEIERKNRSRTKQCDGNYRNESGGEMEKEKWNKERKVRRWLVYPAAHGTKHNEETALFWVCVYMYELSCGHQLGWSAFSTPQHWCHIQAHKSQTQPRSTEAASFSSCAFFIFDMVNESKANWEKRRRRWRGRGREKKEVERVWNLM